MSRSSVPHEVDGGGRFRAPVSGRAPAYLRAHEAGVLKDRVEESLADLGPACRVCPR